MIKEFEFYHGAIFSRILQSSVISITLKKFSTQNSSSYVLNESIGIYVKYSTKRLTPWSYSFSKTHFEELDDMFKLLNNVFILLVCNDDGIVVLSYNELKQILKNVITTGWVSVIREPGKMYSVKGADGELDYKIGRNEFPSKLFLRDLKLLI